MSSLLFKNVDAFLLGRVGGRNLGTSLLETSNLLLESIDLLLFGSSNVESLSKLTLEQSDS